MYKLTMPNSLKRDTSFGNHVLGGVTSLKNITNNQKNVIVEVNIKNIELEEFNGYAIISLIIKDDTGKISAKMIKKGSKTEIEEFVNNLNLKKKYRMNGFITFADEFENDLAIIVINVEEI